MTRKPAPAGGWVCRTGRQQHTCKGLAPEKQGLTLKLRSTAPYVSKGHSKMGIQHRKLRYQHLPFQHSKDRACVFTDVFTNCQAIPHRQQQRGLTSQPEVSSSNSPNRPNWSLLGIFSWFKDQCCIPLCCLGNHLHKPKSVRSQKVSFPSHSV